MSNAGLGSHSEVPGGSWEPERRQQSAPEIGQV